MTTNLPRRQFLKTAGGIAAGGTLLRTTAGAGHALAEGAPPPPRPDLVPVFPLVPLVEIGTTAYVAYTEMTVLGGIMTYGATLSATGFPSSSAAYLVADLRVPADATLLSATVLTAGPANVTATLWCQDMINGGYVGGPTPFTSPSQAVASITQVPPSSGGIAVPVPANYTVPASHKMQIWIAGISSTTPISGVRCTYLPATSGYVPITPTRVYDSRDAGSGGPLSSGATRDVSLANATAFAGGTANVVPHGAYCITYNMTLDGATAQGFLAIYPQGGAFKASAINWFTTGEVVANGGVVTLGGDRTVTVQAGGGGATNFIIDITGYYI